MKEMYKDGDYKVVHNYKVDDMRVQGWSLTKQPVSKKTYATKAEVSVSTEKKADNLSDTHKKALEMGIDIYKDGNLIHHRALAAKIREAENGDQD